MLRIAEGAHRALAYRSPLSAVASTSKCQLPPVRQDCPQCARGPPRHYSSASPTLRQSNSPPIDEEHWETAEKVIKTAGLDVKAAKEAHRQYYRGRRKGTTPRNDAYERHLTRWAGWQRTTTTLGPRLRQHRQRHAQSFHTTAATHSEDFGFDDASASSLADLDAASEAASPPSPGDFVEIRSASLGTVYGIIMATAQPKKKGNESELRGSAQAHASDLVGATRFFLLDKYGSVGSFQHGDVLMRVPFQTAFPDLDSSVIKHAALTASEVEALIYSDTITPGQAGQDVNDPAADPFRKERLKKIYKHRVRICTAMNRFLRQVEVKMESHRRSLFHLMSSADLLEQSYYHLTTSQVALMLDHETILEPRELDRIAANSPPSILSRFVTHQLLMQNHQYFICDETAHVSNAIWLIRPSRERKDLKTVGDWLDEVDWLGGAADAERRNASDDSPIPAFIAKANEAVANGGKVQWSDDDKTILSVLLDAFANSRLVQADLYRHVVSAILKACNFVPPHEPGTYDQVCFSRFREDDWKRERGTMSRSNEQLLSFIKALRLFPEHITDWSLLSANAKRVLESALSLRWQQQQQHDADPTALAPPPYNDLDAHLRSEFDEDVFVIDDPTARELDDGISIGEPRPDGKVWVHVHVADPTSTLTPDEEIAKNARRQSVSLYFSNGTLPLLAGREFQGVASKTAPGPSRVLTFSALVDEQGLAHDVQIMPRTLTKQHILSYDEVLAVLAGKDDAHPHAAKLQRLNRVAAFLRRRRVADGGFIASGVVFETKLTPNADNKGVLTPSGEIPFYLPSPLMLQNPAIVSPINADKFVPPVFGAPEHSVDLEYSAHRNMGDERQAQELVAELMIMAGRVAAAWGSRAVDASVQGAGALSLGDGGGGGGEANTGALAITPTTWSSNPLALPYRTQTFPAQFRDRWLKSINNLKDQNGGLEFRSILEHNVLLSAGELRAVPGEHVSMGIGTSPAGIHSPRNGGETAEAATAATTARDLFDGCGYVRMTSPLRRYDDLIGHWQIKAILHRAFPRPDGADDPADAALQQAIAQRKSDVRSATELSVAVKSLERSARMSAAVQKNSRKHWALKAVRMELERAGKQEDATAEPTPGMPGKNGSPPPYVPPQVAATQGGMTLANPVDSSLSQLITSAQTPAYVTNPLIGSDTDSGRSYARILIPSLGLAGTCPLTPFMAADDFQAVKESFRYVPPRAGHKLEETVGGRYVSERGNSSTPPPHANAPVVGREFPVQLRFAAEEVVGGTLLASRGPPPEGKQKQDVIPSTATFGEAGSAVL